MQFPGPWWKGGVPPPGAFRGPLPGAFIAQPPWVGVGGQLLGMEHVTSVGARTIPADSTNMKIRTWQEAGAVAMFLLRGAGSVRHIA